jgi:tetratricopeptide (TPR) repeat protein
MLEKDPTAESALYPELARANLLRMRGDYKGAEDVCLGILKRYPNNAAAHTLLGDIYAERGELEHAEQWYELALDLEPDSAADREKLEAIRERKRERETAAAAQELGLAPSARPPFALVAAVAALLLVGIAFGAYAIGRNQGGAGTRTVVTDSFVAPPVAPPPAAGDPEPAPTGTADPEPQAPPTPPAHTLAPAPSGGEVLDDAALRQLLAQRLQQGHRILHVRQDPRGNLLTIDFQVAPNEDERAVGAEIALGALEQIPDAQVVTLRAIQANRLHYVADVSRIRTQQMQPNLPASQILANEWLVPGAPTP